MSKITFMGAGSSVFAKNILGDTMLSPALHDAHIALYDIDGKRLRQSKKMLQTLNRNTNKDRAKITAHLGKPQRKAALKDATYVVNAIQVGGYEPSTVIDSRSRRNTACARPLPIRSASVVYSARCERHPS